MKTENLKKKISLITRSTDCDVFRVVRYDTLRLRYEIEGKLSRETTFRSSYQDF